MTNTDNIKNTDIVNVPSAMIPDYISFNYGTDYLNPRNRFQKGYTSISGEPGYFYFRIYFDWSSPLLLWRPDDDLKNISAQKFLANNQFRCDCSKRYKALAKFHKLLYFMSKDTPWAFQKVEGLGEACFTDPKQPGKNNKTFKITFSDEFTDFRITLLLDLYRYIAYDSIHQRVILPDNLKKFNMSILYFGVPLRWFHTPITTTGVKNYIKNSVNEITSQFGKDISVPNSKFDYAGLKKSELQINHSKGKVTDMAGGNYFQDTVSVHMMHFLNCELSLKSTYNGLGSTRNDNSGPFKSNASIEITYDRCYTQDVSEWFEMQISEQFDDYFDQDHKSVTPAPEPANMSKSKSRLKEILANIGKQSVAGIMGADDWEIPRNGISDRRWAIREQKLYGGQSVLSRLNAIAENAIDIVTGMVTDSLQLGNIYDESWLASLKGLSNAKTGKDITNSITNMALGGLAGLNPSLKSLAQGGLGGFANNFAGATGQMLSFNGTQGFKNLFIGNGNSKANIWPDGPTKIPDSPTLNIIKQQPNIYQN